MIEQRFEEVLTWRPIPFETRLGSRAVDMTLILPITAESTGLVYPLVPGLGARQAVYRELAIALAERGHTAALIGYDGCSNIGGQAVEYILKSLEDASFNGKSVPVADTDIIIPWAHSLGPRKLVTALERMVAGGTRIEHGIMEAPACLGGVHPVRAPLDAIRSIRDEMEYITMTGVIQHHDVARDGLRALLSLRSQLLREIHVAMHDSIESRIAELQEIGIHFGAIDHEDDILVSARKNQPAYTRLGIRPFSVNAPYTGHVVPLYHPEEAADAVEEATADLLSKYPIAA